MDAHPQIVATSDGRRLCFAKRGALDGFPVLSMHGTPGCRLLDARRIEQRFEELLSGLGIRFITHDRPGCGRSDRQRGRRLADTAGDVATIADALELRRFAIVGGSSGSTHAPAVAALLPERVFRVACVAPMAPYDQLGSDEWSRDQLDSVRQYVAACLQGEAQAAECGANLRAGPVDAVPPCLRDAAGTAPCPLPGDSGRSGVAKRSPCDRQLAIPSARRSHSLRRRESECDRQQDAATCSVADEFRRRAGS
jgi:pimeloyl-ACP methyl ester carboxylesterase